MKILRPANYFGNEADNGGTPFRSLERVAHCVNQCEHWDLCNRVKHNKEVNITTKERCLFRVERSLAIFYRFSNAWML